jgi:hypothetical protein
MELVAVWERGAQRRAERAVWHVAGRVMVLGLAVAGLLTPPGVAALALIGILR